MMVHQTFTQLLVDDHRNRLLAEAEQMRLQASARHRHAVPRAARLEGGAVAVIAMLVALTFSACASAPLPPAPVRPIPSAASAAPAATASVRIPVPVSPSTRPLEASAPPPTNPTPRRDDVLARATADRYERSLVDAQWGVAWNLLSPVDRALRQSFDAFARERAAALRAIGGRYTLSRPTRDRATFALYTESRALVQGADLRRAWIVQATYPALANNNAGFDVLLVAPDVRGEWRIWEVR